MSAIKYNTNQDIFVTVLSNHLKINNDTTKVFENIFENVVNSLRYILKDQNNNIDDLNDLSNKLIESNILNKIFLPSDQKVVIEIINIITQFSNYCNKLNQKTLRLNLIHCSTKLKTALESLNNNQIDLISGKNNTIAIYDCAINNSEILEYFRKFLKTFQLNPDYFPYFLNFIVSKLKPIIEKSLGGGDVIFDYITNKNLDSNSSDLGKFFTELKDKIAKSINDPLNDSNYSGISDLLKFNSFELIDRVINNIKLAKKHMNDIIIENHSDIFLKSSVVFSYLISDNNLQNKNKPIDYFIEIAKLKIEKMQEEIQYLDKCLQYYEKQKSDNVVAPLEFSEIFKNDISNFEHMSETTTKNIQLELNDRSTVAINVTKCHHEGNNLTLNYAYTDNKLNDQFLKSYISNLVNSEQHKKHDNVKKAINKSSTTVIDLVDKMKDKSNLENAKNTAINYLQFFKHIPGANDFLDKHKLNKETIESINTKTISDNSKILIKVIGGNDNPEQSIENNIDHLSTATSFAGKITTGIKIFNWIRNIVTASGEATGATAGTAVGGTAAAEGAAAAVGGTVLSGGTLLIAAAVVGAGYLIYRYIKKNNIAAKNAEPPSPSLLITDDCKIVCIDPNYNNKIDNLICTDGKSRAFFRQEKFSTLVCFKNEKRTYSLGNGKIFRYPKVLKSNEISQHYNEISKYIKDKNLIVDHYIGNFNTLFLEIISDKRNYKPILS